MSTTRMRAADRLAGVGPGTLITWRIPLGQPRSGMVISTDALGLLVRWDGEHEQKRIPWDADGLCVTSGPAADRNARQARLAALFDEMRQGEMDDARWLREVPWIVWRLLNESSREARRAAVAGAKTDEMPPELAAILVKPSYEMTAAEVLPLFGGLTPIRLISLAVEVLVRDELMNAARYGHDATPLTEWLIGRPTWDTAGPPGQCAVELGGIVEDAEAPGV